MDGNHVGLAPYQQVIFQQFAYLFLFVYLTQARASIKLSIQAGFKLTAMLNPSAPTSHMLGLQVCATMSTNLNGLKKKTFILFMCVQIDAHESQKKRASNTLELQCQTLGSCHVGAILSLIQAENGAGIGEEGNLKMLSQLDPKSHRSQHSRHWYQLRNKYSKPKPLGRPQV